MFCEKWTRISGMKIKDSSQSNNTRSPFACYILSLHHDGCHWHVMSGWLILEIETILPVACLCSENLLSFMSPHRGVRGQGRPWINTVCL